MPETPFATGFPQDSALEDGYVRLERPADDYEPHFATNAATFSALAMAGLLQRLFETLEFADEGTYLLPRSVIETDAASDLQRAMEYADLAPADGCVMPGCLQDVIGRARGFSICAHHDALLQDWDSLVA